MRRSRGVRTEGWDGDGMGGEGEIVLFDCVDLSGLTCGFVQLWN